MATSTVELPREALEQIFETTRVPNFHFQKKQEEIAEFLNRNNLNLEKFVEIVIKSDKTGWKEVVGGITKITGHGFSDLGITNKKIIEKLKAFGNCNEDPVTKKDWLKMLSQKQVVEA